MKHHLFALPVLLITSSLIVSAQQTDKASKPKITMQQARATARAKASGKVKSAGLEKEHGKLVYSFDIENDAGIREIQVDAYSGVIVSDQVETAADEAREAAAERKKSAPKKEGQDASSPQAPKLWQHLTGTFLVRMRVLVIEDEHRLADNIARSLRESAGYAVDCAYDG